MARDDTVRKSPLPAHVERALARARGGGDRKPEPSRGGRWLALVPVSVAVVLFALLMPWATPPDAVPLPDVDERAVAEVARADRARAERARADRLPGDVLAVGSAVRAMNLADAKQADDVAVAAARRHLDDALAAAMARAGAEEDLVALRAVQLEAFLGEVARFEATGDVSEELEALGGGFVRKARAAGWIQGSRVLLGEPELRAAYKVVWNALAGTDVRPAFQPTLDEQRVLYRTYLSLPHPPEAVRPGLDAERRAATTEADCERARFNEHRATELWRAEKIKKLGAIDPTYPTGYALGVAYYRAGRYDLAVEAFRAWLDAHPDGPWSLRARNHLKASLAAYGPS